MKVLYKSSNNLKCEEVAVHHVQAKKRKKKNIQLQKTLENGRKRKKKKKN